MNGTARDRGKRRQHVDRAHLRLDDRSRRVVPGQTHDPRHAQHRIVQKEPVLGFAVIAEAFAVVRDNGDERAVELAGLLERGDERRDAAVDVRDFAVVRRRGESCAERRGRFVGRVRVVQMDPGEKGLRAKGGLRAEG